LSRESANFIIGRTNIRYVRPSVPEVIFCVFVLILLILGTYSRNRVWNSEVELWTDCVKKSPNKDRPYNNLGFGFLNQGKYQEATNQYKEALRINPNSAEAHNNVGLVFLNQDKYQEAIPHLNEALRINPNFAEAHFNLGNAYLRAGNRGLALKEYDILKAMNPGLADALHQRIK
jgi:tetratricopeptide (TPR) repeat protein